MLEAALNLAKQAELAPGATKSNPAASPGARMIHRATWPGKSRHDELLGLYYN